MKRYLQLDALRGLFLIIMALDHYEGFFRKLIYQRIGFVSAAEGFIFLSGIVAGLVYGRYRDKSLLFDKSLKRVLTIYKYHLVTLVIFCTLIVMVPFYHESWNNYVPSFVNQPLPAFISAAILLYQPYFTDILPLYIVLVFIMPFLIILLQKSRIGIFWAVICSLWLLGFFLGQPDYIFEGTMLGYLPIHLGNFNILSWQFIFFIGLYFGFRKQMNSDYATKINMALFFISILVAGFFFSVRNGMHLGIDYGLDFTTDKLWFHFIFNKFNLGIGRIVNFLAISYIMAVLLRRYNALLRNSWLVILGQHSIKVYAAHLISLFFFYPMIPLVEQHGVFWQILFSLSMLLPLYFVVYKDLPFSFVQRKSSVKS
jgi:hypothetical protein